MKMQDMNQKHSGKKPPIHIRSFDVNRYFSHAVQRDRFNRRRKSAAASRWGLAWISTGAGQTKRVAATNTYRGSPLAATGAAAVPVFAGRPRNDSCTRECCFRRTKTTGVPSSSNAGLGALEALVQLGTA